MELHFLTAVGHYSAVALIVFFAMYAWDSLVRPTFGKALGVVALIVAICILLGL